MNTQNTNAPSMPATGQVRSDFEQLLQRDFRASSVVSVVDAAPDKVKALESFGSWIAKSTMFGANRIEEGVIIAVHCYERRMGLVEFSQKFYLIPTRNGTKIFKNAMAAQVEFEDLGGVVRWIDLAHKSDKAEVELEYKGEKHRFTFSLDDAESAGLKGDKTSGMYEKWKSEMLCSRALSRGLKRICPRVYVGCDDGDVPETVTALALPATAKPTPETKPAAPAHAPATAPAPAATAPAPAPAKEVVVEQPTHPDNPVKAETAVATGPAPRIPQELADKVFTVVGAHVTQAIAWMRKPTNQWLTTEEIEAAGTGNPFVYLTKMRADKVLANPAGFIRAISNPAGSQ